MEVAEPIKTADEPVVVQLKQAPVMAIQPTGEEVEIAAVVTPPPAAELAAGHRADTGSGGDAPANGESVAADRAVRTAGFGRSLGLRLVQKRIL